MWRATRAWYVALPPSNRLQHHTTILAQHRVMINMPERDAQGRAGAYGGRKNASAYARVAAGTGRFTVNRVPLAYYFSTMEERKVALFPLIALEACGGFDVDVHVKGGGVMGQAGAIRNAVARALVKFDPYLKPVMKRHNLLVVRSLSARAYVQPCHYFVVCSATIAWWSARSQDSARHARNSSGSSVSALDLHSACSSSGARKASIILGWFLAPPVARWYRKPPKHRN